MLRISTVLAAALLVASAARADAPQISQVRDMLSAFEGGPSAEAWEALGPETVQVLEQLYDDRGQPPFVRLRAVRAAGHFPTEASHAFLRRVAHERNQSDLFIRASLRSMAKAFGGSALGDIEPFLAHRDTVVREGAALALGAIHSPRALSLLRSRLAVERDATVKATLRRVLR